MNTTIFYPTTAKIMLLYWSVRVLCIPLWLVPDILVWACTQMTWICCAGHWVHTEGTRGKRTAYSGSRVGDRAWPFLYKCCCGVSVPDNAKHKQFHPLLRGFPHSKLDGWPAADPVLVPWPRIKQTIQRSLASEQEVGHFGTLKWKQLILCVQSWFIQY